MRNSTRRLSLLGLLLGIAAVCALLTSIDCRDNCTGQPSPHLPGSAHVRFVHAASDIGGIDFFFDSIALVHGARFNTFDSAPGCYRDCANLAIGSLRVLSDAGPLVGI